MSRDPSFPPPPPPSAPRAPLPVQAAPPILPPPGSYAPAPYAAPGWASPPAAYPYVVHRSDRPGVLSAIGVISIIVASVTLLGCFTSVMWGVTLMRVARMTATASSSSSQAPTLGAAGKTPAPGAPKATGGATGLQGSTPGLLIPGPRGFGAEDRKTIVDAWETLEDLPPARQRQLKAMFAKAGQDILPLNGRPADFDTARAAVRDHGTLPNADPNESAPLYFDLPGGQLQVYDDRAVFRPTEAGAPIVRASASPEPLANASPAFPTAPDVASPPAPKAHAGPVDPFADDEDASAPPAGATGSSAKPAAAVTAYPSGLTPAQVQSIVQKAQMASANKLNAAQLKTIHTSLEAQGQQLVTPATMWAPIAMAVTQPDGSAVVKFSNSYLWLDAQGQVMQQGTTGMQKVSLNPLAVALVLSEAIVSAALAILLLTAGVLVLKQSPKGRLLHLLYAMLKIPLAIGGAVGLVWLTNEFITASGSGGAGGMETFGVITASLAVIYPIALLIAMSTRSVRAYYASIRNEGSTTFG